MGRDYTDDGDDHAGWDAAFVAPMRAEAPRALAGLRLDQALARMFPQYSRSRLQAWLAEGHIRVDGARAEARRLVRGGERVDLAPPVPPAGAAPRAQKIPLKVVFEDEALLVLDKPAGLVVHPGAGVPDRTLMNALLAHAPQVAGVPRAGIVHRLDKDTTGLMVVAKTVEAQTSLVRQLAERRIRRVYWAVVHGDPPAGGTIDAPVGRDARARTRMAVTRRGKDAVTRYRVLERYGRAALVECRLETGRTHQIRVHFQHIRHPLVGEPTYRRGTRHGVTFGRQALHAAELSLVHPVSGQPMTWRVAPPPDFKRLVAGLQRDHS
ncbi:MAG TPA: RluA family pseudouridine synthase [Burkholderiales bacterium]|nr:RluA family pseudouridine synthase [Burkholderiales bacterium]